MSTAFSPQETNEPEATPGGSIVSDLLVAACILGGGYLVITGLGMVAYRLYGAAPSMVAMHCLIAMIPLLYFLTRPSHGNGVVPTMTSSELADRKVSVGFCIATFCIIIPIAVLGYNSMRNAKYDEYTTSALIALTIASCIAAPIAEELLWRKMTYRLFYRRALHSQYPAVLAYTMLITVPVAFGLAHNNAFQAIMVIPLSLLLTALYMVTKNVKLTIAIHVLYNACYTVLTPMLRPTFDTLDRDTAQYVWVGGMALAIVCVVYVLATLKPGIVRDVAAFGTLPEPQPKPHAPVAPAA